MLVSVIIPTYNRKDLLKDAINSVLNQSYNHFEVIIVDDLSNDGTKDFILGLKNKKIKYICNKKKLYAAQSRNVGINYSNGDLIAFLDDDDIWLASKLEKQVKLFDDKNVGFVYSGTTLFFENYNISYNTKPILKGRIYKDMLINNYIGATPSVVVRKVALLECLEKKQYFDNLFIAREEYDLWIRLSKKWKVDFVSEPLVKQYYRNNINRISSNVYSYVKANDLLDSKYAKDIEIRLTKKERTQRLSVQSFFLGSQAIKINNSKLARKYYLEAFKTNKNIKSFLIYFACFFGAKFVVKLRCYFK